MGAWKGKGGRCMRGWRACGGGNHRESEVNERGKKKEKLVGRLWLEKWIPPEDFIAVFL